MVRVEPAGLDAWERWREIRLRALRDAPDAFGSSFEREEAYTESDWRRWLTLGPTWIAVVDERDVGIICGGQHHSAEIPWVYAMWVEPTVRGTGVAESLLGVVIDWARQSGASLLGLDVADRAPRAKRFYERNGFVIGDQTFPMPRDPSITLYEMFLDLTGAVPASP